MKTIIRGGYEFQVADDYEDPPMRWWYPFVVPVIAVVITVAYLLGLYLS